MSSTEEGASRICHKREGRQWSRGNEAADEEVRTEDTWDKESGLNVSGQQSGKKHDIEKNVMHGKALMKKYEVLGGRDLPEDVRATVISDLCTKDTKDLLELRTPRDEVQRDSRRDRELCREKEGSRRGFGG